LIDRWMDYLPDEKKSPNRSGIRLPRGRIVPPPSPASQLRRGGRIGGEEGGRGGEPASDQSKCEGGEPAGKMLVIIEREISWLINWSGLFTRVNSNLSLWPLKGLRCRTALLVSCGVGPLFPSV
jgi:hypothetical protein